jgi:hypothetical protein
MTWEFSITPNCTRMTQCAHLQGMTWPYNPHFMMHNSRAPHQILLSRIDSSLLTMRTYFLDSFSPDLLSDCTANCCVICVMMLVGMHCVNDAAYFHFQFSPMNDYFLFRAHRNTSILNRTKHCHDTHTLSILILKNTYFCP